MVEGTYNATAWEGALPCWGGYDSRQEGAKAQRGGVVGWPLIPTAFHQRYRMSKLGAGLEGGRVGHAKSGR